MSSYQSSAFEDVPVHEDRQVLNQPPQQTSNPYQDTGSYNIPVDNYSGFGVAHDDTIPSQSISFKDAFSPFLKNYVGLGIVKFVYWVAYILAFLLALFFIFIVTSNGFRWHWAAGVIGLLFSLVTGFLGLVCSLFTIRLALEVVISIFVLREKVTALAKAQIKNI
jgi:hypothetical protein